jgi:prepilin-type processing-associated H-X9-DG protein
MQISTPKSLVCPSSEDQPNMDVSPQAYWDFGVGDITGPANPGQVRQGWNQVSYGYQVPFGKHGRPSSDCDLRMPLAADKGPFGAALDAGLPNPPLITGHTFASPEQWRPWNSPNHGGQGRGEGQNVLFADGHVDWASKPIVGVGNDNIYTQWSGTEELARVQGNRPTAGGKQTPAGNTDALIYP